MQDGFLGKLRLITKLIAQRNLRSIRHSNTFQIAAPNHETQLHHQRITMSRRHSSSPDAKPITTRLHKLTALLDELAKAPHQPDDTAEFLPTKLLKRVLAFVGSGGSAGATNQRWRRVAANPELWRDAVQRAAIRAESRETADGRARQQAKDVISALRAASRALAATPGSRIAELRDAMAAAARRQRRAPTDVERPVLEASCDVLGLNSATVCSRRPLYNYDGRGDGV